MRDSFLEMIKLRHDAAYISQLQKLGKDVYSEASSISFGVLDLFSPYFNDPESRTLLERITKIVVIYVYGGALHEQYNDDAAYGIMAYAYDSFYNDPLSKSACPATPESFQAEISSLESKITSHQSAGSYNNFYIISRYIADYVDSSGNLSANRKLVYDVTRYIRERLGQDISAMSYEQYCDFCLDEALVSRSKNQENKKSVRAVDLSKKSISIVKRFLSWLILVGCYIIVCLYAALNIAVMSYAASFYGTLSAVWKVVAIVIGGAFFVSLAVAPIYYGSALSVGLSNRICESKQGTRYSALGIFVLVTCLLEAIIDFGFRDIIIGIYGVVLIYFGRSIKKEYLQSEVERRAKELIEKDTSFSRH